MGKKIGESCLRCKHLGTGGRGGSRKTRVERETFFEEREKIDWCVACLRASAGQKRLVPRVNWRAFYKKAIVSPSFTPKKWECVYTSVVAFFRGEFTLADTSETTSQQRRTGDIKPSIMFHMNAGIPTFLEFAFHARLPSRFWLENPPTTLEYAAIQCSLPSTREKKRACAKKSNRNH